MTSSRRLSPAVRLIGSDGLRSCGADADGMARGVVLRRKACAAVSVGLFLHIASLD